MSQQHRTDLSRCRCILTAAWPRAPTPPTSRTFLPFLKESQRPTSDSLLLISTSSAHQWLPSHSRPSTRSHSICPNKRGKTTADRQDIVQSSGRSWRGVAGLPVALRWADGDFFLFALILFVNLLDWMTVRVPVPRGSRSVLLKGNQTNRPITSSGNSSAKKTSIKMNFISHESPESVTPLQSLFQQLVKLQHPKWV